MSTAIAPYSGKPKGEYIITHEFGNTNDIMSALIADYHTYNHEVKSWAKKNISPTIQGLEDLWSVVKNNIEYRKDPIGKQWIKTPRRLFADGVGDCKSYSLFIASVLKHIGIKHAFRFTSYDRSNKTPTHVYVVAYLHGRKVVLDAVYTAFNKEKAYSHKTDKHMTQIATLNGLEENMDIVQMDTLDFIDSLPDNLLDDDYTDGRTEGAVIRAINRDLFVNKAKQSALPSLRRKYKNIARAISTGSVSGLGSVEATPINDFLKETAKMTRPAFEQVDVIINDPAMAGFFKKIGKGLKKAAKKVSTGLKKGAKKVSTGIKKGAKKVVTGVKKTVKKIGAAIGKLWAKLMNWIIKKALPKASNFFLFRFLKKKQRSEVERRKSRQNSTISWMKKTGRMSDSVIDASIRKGIVDKTRLSPEAVLNRTARSVVAGGIGIVPLAAAAPSILTGAFKAIKFIIEKIAGLFKKRKASVSESDGSDLGLLGSESVQINDDGIAYSDEDFDAQFDQYGIDNNDRDNLQVSSGNNSVLFATLAAAAVGVMAMK